MHARQEGEAKYQTLGWMCPPSPSQGKIARQNSAHFKCEWTAPLPSLQTLKAAVIMSYLNQGSRHRDSTTKVEPWKAREHNCMPVAWSPLNLSCKYISGGIWVTDKIWYKAKGHPISRVGPYWVLLSLYLIYPNLVWYPYVKGHCLWREASLLVLFPHLNWQQWCSRRAETLRSTGHDFTSREHPEARHPVASLDQLPRKRPGLQEVGQNLQSWTKWHQSQGWHDSPQIAAVASHFQVLLHQRVAEVWRLVVAKKAPKDFFWGTGVTHVTPCCPSSCHSKNCRRISGFPNKKLPLQISTRHCTCIILSNAVPLAGGSKANKSRSCADSSNATKGL